MNERLAARLILLVLILCAGAGRCQVSARAIPVHEVRAVWITTVNGLDWPPPGDAGQQKRSLIEIVARLAAAHYNTIYFQVRSRGDAVFRSPFEPWAQQLTGVFGKDPGWDPLAVVIAEAHERGIEVHAWFNTFDTRSGRALPARTSPPHILLKHPEWLHIVEGEWWLDPGIPAARRYVLNVAMDIVRRYDIDGIQFDYLRYPGRLFPDDAAYRRYGAGSSKEDWRRENVNTFVRVFYDSAMALKPMLKVGSAPIGIYANSPQVNGLQSYSDVYQDSREWLREGKQDYLVPQTYWPLGKRPGSPDFARLAKEWSEHTYGRDVYPGIGAYKPDVFEEIPRLIDLTRSLGFHGHSFFRYGSIERALEAGGRYGTLALIPSMSWKDSIPPNPPRSLAASGIAGGVFRLRWSPPAAAADGDRAREYAVYRSMTSPVDVADPRNLVAIVLNGATEVRDTIPGPSAARYFYAVSAIDKGNNESARAEAEVFVPEIAQALGTFAPVFKLGKQYPDPASSIVFVPYDLADQATVSLTILDEQDRPVLELVHAGQPPGRYVAAGDLARLKNGLYSYRLVAGPASRRREFRIQK